MPAISARLQRVSFWLPGPQGEIKRPERFFRAVTIWRMFLFTYLALVLICGFSLSGVLYLGRTAAAFSIAVCLTYCVLYLLPILATLLVFNHLVSLDSLRGVFQRLRLRLNTIVFSLAVLGFSVVLFFVLADTILYRILNFHINGFVWNTLFTKGGIESLGATESMYVAVAFVILGVLGLEALFLALAIKSALFHRALGRVFSRRVIAGAIALLLLLAALERIAFGVANIYSYRPVLIASRAFLFYIPCTFDLPAWISPPAKHSVAFRPSRVRANSLLYPLKPIESRPDAPRYNVVFLVAESLRGDALNPEIMPFTCEFAQKSLWFRNHYSGGNGTRMGLFALFYGLYPNSWFAFLHSTQPPALNLLLKERNYQFALFTSARFTYPEFDKTIWAGLEPSIMLEGDPRLEGWQNDRAHVGRLLDFLDQRDTDRPFMAFLFFESPHARYYFPPESAIRTPYLKDFNYLTTSLRKEIHLIKNRYDNSCHHLDTQIQRVVEGLEARGLMDSTILVFTGDHGEEFMEKGHWGHNSAFTEEQLRTPLALWIPGHAPRQFHGLSSHMDVPPTLMTLLGVKNPPRDYCHGRDLLGSEPTGWTVVGSWGDLAFVDADCKILFSLDSLSFSRPDVTTRDDQPVADPVPFLESRHPQFAEIMRNLERFTR